MKPTARLLASILLSFAAATCADPPSPPELSCAFPAVGDIQGGDSLVVTDSEAPCTIEFREVARLRGSGDGPDPVMPVALGPGGSYVTPTYTRGEVAVWSARGELVRTVGNGEGSGPGEFDHVSSLLVDSDSVINILPGLPHWHRYSWSGAFLETVRVPTGAATTGMAMTGDGTLVTPAMTDPGLPLIVWRKGADSVQVIDSPRRITGRSSHFVRGSAEMGIWSLELERYVLRRHDRRNFGIDGQVVREADWFPGPREDIPALVFRFAVDDRGLLWTLVTLQAPDAPSAPRPQATSEEERRTIDSRYRNTMIEVLTVDGRLLASRTYEEIGTIPRPATAERWYRAENDPFPSIVILEPRLVER